MTSRKMKSYLKCVFLFFPFIILVFLSCSEEEPIYFAARPLAIAGADQLVEIFDTVSLDASSSTNNENVEYIWSFDSKPSGSTTVFSDSTLPNPTFIADASGFYNIKLAVKINESYSDPDYAVIQSIIKKSEEYFPQKVGNKWKYKVYDETGIIKDMLTIKVVGTKTLPNGELASVWVYDGTSHIFPYSIIDTLYLVTIEDTLVYYFSLQNSQVPFLGYIVPLSVGTKWTSWSWWWTEVSVLEKIALSIDIGTFQEVCKVEHLIPGSMPVSGFLSYNWIIPHLGLAKMGLYEPDQPPYYSEEHWELFWYELVE